MLEGDNISTINEYWNWLENSFVDNVRAQQWSNGDAPRNLSGYINDKTNRLIGWITTRQLRVKSHQCQLQQNLSSECEDDYSLFNEEKQSFDPGWKLDNQTKQVYSSTIVRAFKYQSGNELDSYIYIDEHGKYGSGGYVYEFRGSLSDIRSNLSLLHQLEWINRETRAVIIQFNLYNPNVQLFSSITLLIEFLSTGGLYPQSRFEPFSFQSIIVCSWTSVGIYLWTYLESKRLGDLFKETNGYVYINLQMSVSINDLLIYLMSFCCFFGTIKFARLCRFHRRLLLFIKTIQHAGKDLLSYLFLFYLLFISKLSTCSTLFSTAEMLFEIILMKFDAYELMDTSPFLGPFCFSLFIFLVVFVCLSVFITILNDSFRFVCDHIKHHQNEDEQIFTFMFHRFRRWISISYCYMFCLLISKFHLGKQSELEIAEEQDEEMRSKYYDPIERFPEKIDQLLEALDRIYV